MEEEAKVEVYLLLQSRAGAEAHHVQAHPTRTQTLFHRTQYVVHLVHWLLISLTRDYAILKVKADFVFFF
jgi:hypothetical protein